MSAQLPTVPTIPIPVSTNPVGQNSNSPSPTPGSAPIPTLPGAVVGLGATQPASNSAGGGGSLSLVGQGSNGLDFNSFARTNVLDPDLLRPLDDFLATNIVSGTAIKEVKVSLKFYSMEPSSMFTPGSTDLDLARTRSCLDLLRALRQGQRNVIDCTLDEQRDLVALCGIPFKDADVHTISSGLAHFTSLFLPSFTIVATQSDAAWSDLKVKGLRVHLGILGMTIDPDTTTKPELRDLVAKARFLTVAQGRLIPDMRSPFVSFSFPERDVLVRTSLTFQVTLIASIIDLTVDPLPAAERFIDTITSFRGLSANLSFFDANQWSQLTDVFDRMVFLHMFLSVFGVSIDLLARLTSDDLLLLIPNESLEVVPIHRPVVVARTPPEIRKRRLVYDAIRAGVQSASAMQATALATVPSSSVVTTPGPLPSGLNPLLPVLGSTVISSQITPTPPASMSVLPGGTSSLSHDPPDQTSDSSLLYRSTMPGSTFGLGATQLDMGLCVRGDTSGSSHVSSNTSQMPGAGLPVETRFITDSALIGTEYSQTSLTALPPLTLRALVAHVCQTTTSQVPPSMSAQSCASIIWDRQTIRSFRFLVTSTPVLYTRLPGGTYSWATYPCPHTYCMLSADVNGQVLEASYSIRTRNADPFSPAVASLTIGDPTIFPSDGTILPGDGLLVAPLGPAIGAPNLSVNPNFHGHLPSVLHPTSTGYLSSQVVQMSQNQLQLADKLSGTSRKAADGTRLVKDVWSSHTPAALAAISTDVTASGTQLLSTVLFDAMFPSERYMQCCLCTLVALSRHFIDLDPNHFVNLSSVTDMNTARSISTAFIRHRPETPYPGRYREFWDEQPDRLLGALVNVFDLFSALYLADPRITAE